MTICNEAFYSTLPFLHRLQATTKTNYGYIYFTGESYSNGEQIYFAVSTNNTPIAWNAVNGGNPVLTSTLGTKGVRDPFIIQHPTTGRWYVIATDLRMYGSSGWTAASHNGSLSLSIWDSADLKTWSAQRLVKVSPSTAGMSWAPEATWDAASGQFYVYWASNLFASTDTGHTGTTYARILYATTKDFITFSTAQTWIDYGVDVIDATVTYDSASGYYHRFIKTNGQVDQERSTSFFGTWSSVTKGIGQSLFGDVEGPLVFSSILYPNEWHVWVDDISPQGYEPFESSNITSGVWTFSSGYSLPAHPRHGTVFQLTADQAANLASLT
ncbi:Arabinanase/levansucrase/invertase [Clavulina sp. PMI_390]|nr:Arabinanase/levansucrase/invertase [Clavulina sp. PMI_390]